jgi:hypothetical protein
MHQALRLKGGLMAHFLRDQHVQNLAISDDSLTHINSIFVERFHHLQAGLKEMGEKAFLTYIIRFDNKGYRVFSLEELLNYFNHAQIVERVIFSIESEKALNTGRIVGAFLELNLDAKDPSRCTLVSTSDNKDWAEASFSAVHEAITKFKTRNGIARTPWTNLLVQLLGVVVIFIASLWMASRIAPNVNTENAFILSFLFILLVFSNIWGYLNQLLLSQIGRLFPNIDFIRPAKAQLHWLLQALVGSAAFASAIYLFGLASSFLLKVLLELFGITT